MGVRFRDSAMTIRTFQAVFCVLLSVCFAYAAPVSAPSSGDTTSDVSTPSPVPLCKGSDPKKWDRCIGNLPISNLGDYTGEFRKGRPDGAGRFVGRDGSLYQGDFKLGVPSGKGRFTSPNGTVYLGEFSDGVANGQGRETAADGTTYIGAYINGAREGQGSLNIPGVRRFEGEFKADRIDGYGTYTFPNGDFYTGVVTNDSMSEQGIYQFSNGDRYVGTYKDFKPSGHGVLTTKSGLKWVGEFTSGIPDGFGSLYDANGELIAEKIFRGVAELQTAKTEFDNKKSQAAATPKSSPATITQQSDIAQSASVQAPNGVPLQTDQKENQDLKTPQPNGGEHQNSVTLPDSGRANPIPSGTPLPEPVQVSNGGTGDQNKPLSCQRGGDILISYVVCDVLIPQADITAIRYHNDTCRSGADYLAEYDAVATKPWTDLYSHIKAHYYFRPFDYRGIHRFRDKVYFLAERCKSVPAFTITINKQEWDWPLHGDQPKLLR